MSEKKKIEIHDGYVWLNNEKIPLLSGEFHFWRNNKKFWPRILDSIKDLGFKHITSYIEWRFHRLTSDGTPIEKIKYDFTGIEDQQADLDGYLSMIDERKDIWLSIRPGPYIYSETEFGGVPEEASFYHRNHPKFLELAEDYIKNVSAILEPHLATNGGRILFCQLDNECSAIKHLNQVMELTLDDPSSFQSYIKEKYGDFKIAAEKFGLEDEWEEWDDVEPLPAMPMNEKEFLLFLDTAEYLEWYNALFLKKIADMYRKYGIDVPFYINSTGPPFPHNPKMLDSFVDLRTVDLYYLKKHRLINMLSFNSKLLKSNSPAVVAGEFRTGDFRGYTMTTEDYKYQSLLWMAYGFHGVNYYMLVERHRWPHTPIDAVGRPLDSYDMFKTLVNAYNKIDYPRFTCGNIAEINLMWYRPHAYTDKQASLEPGFNLEEDNNYNYMFKSLLHANIPFDFWHQDSKYSDINDKPFLIYAGHDFIDIKTGGMILEYIRNGGKVIFINNFPIKYVNGSKCDIFTRYLVKPSAAVKISGRAAITFGNETISLETGVLMDYEIDEKNEDFKCFKNRHMKVGYSRKIGKGEAYVLGFDPGPSCIRKILNICGWKGSFTVNSSELLSTVYHLDKSRELLVTIVNPSENSIDAILDLDLKELGIDPDSFTKKASCQSLYIEQDVELKNNRKIQKNIGPKNGEMFYIRY